MTTEHTQTRFGLELRWREGSHTVNVYAPGRETAITCYSIGDFAKPAGQVSYREFLESVEDGAQLALEELRAC